MEPVNGSKEIDLMSITSSIAEITGSSLDTGSAAPDVGKNTKDELPKVGMTCGIKNLWEGERKECGCCVDWLEEYPKDIGVNLEETETVQKFALLVRNKRTHDSKSKAMAVSSIVVQSPLLKPLLEEVFDGYEGITATLKKVSFKRPFAPFFYRWSQFLKAVDDAQDEATRAHAILLRDILSRELEETITTYQDLLSNGVMTYDYLWTMFKPGDLLLTQLKGEDLMVKLESTEYGREGFTLHSKYVDWDGYNFGYAGNLDLIAPFEGTRAITDLGSYPIHFDGEAAIIQGKLADRGKKFEKLQGYHYKMYRGMAEMISNGIGHRLHDVRSRTLEGRIIIDAELYDRYNPIYRSYLVGLDSVSFKPSLGDDDGDSDKEHDTATVCESDYDRQNRPTTPPSHPSNLEPKILPEELYPICTPILRGYSLRAKKWAKFKVDSVDEIVWDDQAFDSLVLPPSYKDLILAFTKNQDPEEGILDDVIEGKGQGIVMLLSGEPGVGKTLTAESVAEHLRVPLYSMAAGQLGVRSEEVEQSLGDILEMTTRWKAVLLLDETEVFLEQRDNHRLERNKLVSIFLRTLEYFRGVLFLTTNRVNVLDKAMESRIHLKMSYPELDQAARLQIWRNLVHLLPSSKVGLHEPDFQFLAQKNMNGRQIKNSIKAAQLLANGQDAPLNLEHVQTVLRITQSDETTTAQV